MGKVSYPPSPWVVRENKNPVRFTVDDANGKAITTICVMDQPKATWEVSARLIAAIPELLEALKFSLAELVQYDVANTPGGAMEKAREKAIKLAEKAIAKAEGK